MISLHSMTIQGIRSFGPHLEDQQKIRFNSPVTLVLGQNGCGKTTIIESLKYCLTGELPPSTSGLKGGSFIHDPKIAELCEVRGNVKLKVKIFNDDCLTISRSAQVTQKAKSFTFRTLDCSITFENEDDKKQASKKCINVEQEVCRIFGVSKSILNYVIFCHQEESYWPLDEPKKVKEKFDAIFNTTRFNKALDQIIKIRKNYQSEINGLMIELKGLEKMKTIVDEKKLKILQMEEKLKECEIKIKELSYSVNPIEMELKKVKDRELELSEIHGSRESKKTLCVTLQKQLEELEFSIKGTYEGNNEELEEEIEKFDSQFNNKSENLDKIKLQLTQYNAKEETISRRLNQEQNRLGQLQSEEDQHQSRITNLKAIIVTLSNDLNIFFSQDEFNYEQKIDNIKSNFKKLNDDYLKKKNEFEESEKVIQKKILVLRDSKVQIEHDITSKSRQLAENKQDVKKIQSELNQIEQASSDLTRLEQKIEKVKNELKEATDSEDIESLKSKIKSLENISTENEVELEKIYKEVETLQKQNSIQIEYDNLKENKSVKESDIKKMKNKHFANIKRLLKIEDFPEQGIKFQFKNFMDTLSNDLIKKNDILKQKQKDLLILENNRKHLKEKIQDVENDLKAKEESIYDTYGNEDFNETVTTLNTTIENLQDQKGTLTSSDIMYRRYVEQLKSSEPCCPLCHRDFSNEADITELIYELESKVKEVPTKIKNNKEELETLQDKYKNMLKMQPTVETIKNIKEHDLPSQRSKLKDIEKNIDKLKSEIQELNLELQSPISDEELAKNMLGDIVILDQHLIDFKKISREMEKLEAQLTNSGERNLKQALAHQETLRNDSTNNRQQLSLLNSRLNKYTILVNELNEKLNSLVKDQLVIQGNAQKREQYISRLNELEKTISKLTKEHAEISEKLTPAKEDLENTTSDHEQKIKEHKKILEKDSQKIDDLKIRLNEINRITRNIDDYNKVHNAGEISSLEEVKNQIEKLEKERKTLLEKKNELSNQIKEQTNFISNQELRLRELKDIKKQRTLIKEVKELEDEIKTLRDKLIQMNHDAIQKEKKKLMAERDQIDRDTARMEGSKKEMQSSLGDLNEEISKPDFKYADKNYYDKLIKLKIKELSCDDLHKYYNALDWSLQQFHKRKMEQVNAIIKDMWRDIYSGNDIDYIQIKTEDEGVKDITKKRTFTYGVVQHRNRATIEMRGRCSAGQKMLACLIIRMALAQTFSANCGIMTLDEPTTNLDRENIKAMCENLSDLLSSEHARKNLQFVIITHDDKFLEELRRLDTLDTYYRVARNSKGLSTLSRQRI